MAGEAPRPARWSGLLSILALTVWPDLGVQAQEPRATDRGGEVVRLRGELLTARSLLFFPIGMAVIKDMIVVLDPAADSALLLLDHAGRVLGSLGRNGEGPGEFEAVVAADDDPTEEGVVWVVDGALRRATKLKEESTGARRWRVESTKRLAGGGTGPITSAFVDSESAILAAGFFPLARFARFSQGTWFPIGPPPPGETGPTEIRQHAYQTSVARDPMRTRFAAATRYSDRLEVYSSDGTRLASASRSRGFDPVYRIASTGQGVRMATTFELRYGYVGLAANGAGIYALYSGRNHLEAPGRAAYAAVVEFFTWDAQRQRTYSLDRDVVAIAIDAPGTTLYAIVHEPLPAIIRYRLPALHRQ